MIALADLLVSLAEGISAEVGSPEAGARVEVCDFELTIPVEARIERGGVLHATLPRGRMATGFQVSHGHFRARFSRGAP